MDLDHPAVFRRRMHAQGLAGPGFGSVADAVSHLGAVQAQELAEAKWSLAERVPGCTDADVDAALDRGEILRTHVLRPTWHFVAAADLRWMLALSAPRVHLANRAVYRQAGLDDATFERSHQVLHRALEPGEALTRTELAACLGEAGVQGAAGVRLAHILMHAELEGLVCSGPRRGKQHTYLLVDQRVPEVTGPDGEDAVAELTRRFFISHGPATVNDFAWWSGLTVTQARRGIELTGEALSHEEGWYAAAAEAPSAGAMGARLLPTFDELNVAYRDLRLTPDGALKRLVLIEGECVGTWKRTLAGDSVTVEATLSARLSRAQRAALEAAVDRFGTALGLTPILVAARL